MNKGRVTFHSASTNPRLRDTIDVGLEEEDSVKNALFETGTSLLARGARLSVGVTMAQWLTVAALLVVA